MNQPSTSYVLLDTGDLSAPKDSALYARAVYEEARSGINDVTSGRNDLRFWINALRENNRFHMLTNQHRQHFLTWEQFCTTTQPFGLGYDPDDIEQIIRDREKTPVQRAAEAEAERETDPLPRRGEIGNGRSRSRGSTSTSTSDNAYRRTARIARDHPAILQKMKDGAYTSVRRAAIDAGIVAPRISIPTDPTKAARALRRHFTTTQIQELIAALTEPSQ